MHSPEKLHTTPSIYSLQNRVITRDELVWDEKKVHRIVEYRQADPSRAPYAQRLVQQGLVLGREVRREGKRLFYEVPSVTRPLHLEMPSPSTDPSAYTDADMAYDLGELAGIVARECDGRIITGPAEDAFGIVDFVHPGERQLYLLPGTEQLLSEPVADGSLQAMNAQMQEFSSDFGRLYGAHVPDFIQGYTDALAARGR